MPLTISDYAISISQHDFDKLLIAIMSPSSVDWPPRTARSATNCNIIWRHQLQRRQDSN